MYFVVRIGYVRNKEKIELYAGNSELLKRLIRSHGNLVETAPMLLIMLACLETLDGPSLMIKSLALIFAISRTIHPLGLSGVKKLFPCRPIAMVMTLVVYVVTALYLCYLCLPLIF